MGLTPGAVPRERWEAKEEGTAKEEDGSTDLAKTNSSPAASPNAILATLAEFVGSSKYHMPKSATITWRASIIYIHMGELTHRGEPLSMWRNYRTITFMHQLVPSYLVEGSCQGIYSGAGP